jgi:hypothetical protein
MHDMTQFENLFEQRLRAFARTGVQSVDSAAVARAVAVGQSRSAATRPAGRRLLNDIHRNRHWAMFGPWGMPFMVRTALGAAAVVAVVALGGAIFVTQRDQHEVGGPTAGTSASRSQVTPATPSPTPTPFVISGGREWTVTVRNESSDPTTLFVTEETETGVGRQCGTVTPSVVPPDTTMEVTFLLPPKTVTSCWIWVNPVPGKGGSFFQTSDAPMKGDFLIMADGQTMWGGQ